MLIYRSAGRAEEAGRLVDALHDRFTSLCQRGTMSYDDVIDVLLGCAELESAVCDARQDDRGRDDIDSSGSSLRRLTGTAAMALVRHWRGQPAPVVTTLAPMNEILVALGDDLGRLRVQCRTPEGFAHYAVYPDTYIDAAEQFARSCAPAAATIIGIRTIGTSLSSVVAATLAADGVDVLDATVRPDGHPFDRTVRVGPSLGRVLRDRHRGWFLIVDEGPGLSGSSFASVADALGDLGIPDDRIVFLPSWMPSADSLCNEHARARWRHHQKFIGDFDRGRIDNGRLARRWGGRIVADWSAGMWRDALATDRLERPAIHPQHEQRKYLVEQPNGTRLVLKFNGLGRYGRSRTSVARRMAADGWAPRVLGAAEGFIATAFAPGTPLRRGALTKTEIVQVGRYIAARPRSRHDDVGASNVDLASMIDTNVAELFGNAWREAAAAETRASAASSCRCCVVDGRMQSHEWIRSPDGTLLKMDGAAHHDDHFFPGCVDVAWDVAGACVELCATDPERRLLLDAYAAASGDGDVRQRLPYWLLAYSAFRAGYARVAAASLGDSPDGRGMAALGERYTDEIQRLLSR